MGTLGEEQRRGPCHGDGDAMAPVERLLILMKMKPGKSLADPILLSWEGNTFVPPWQQKCIKARDAFCLTHSNFFIQMSVPWKCKLKTMKNSKWDRAIPRALGISRDGHSRTRKPSKPGDTSKRGRSGAPGRGARSPRWGGKTTSAARP